MKKPLQHRILDLLADGPRNFSELCEKLSPEYRNRNSIYGALQAMRHAKKVRICGWHQVPGKADLAIWELAPAVSNALFECWPVPIQLPQGTVRKHRLEL